MNETIEASAPSQELLNIGKPYALPDIIQNKVINTLAPFVRDAGEIAREAEGVIVTDVEQVDEIKKSRELRLKLQKVRVAADKARKALKEEYLKPGQFIDAAGRHIMGLIDPVETRLEQQEKIVERQEAERKAKIVAERHTLLAEYIDDTRLYDLANMSDKAFSDLLAGQKALATQRREQAEREAKAKAEADRLRDEQEAKTRAENERLRQEAMAAQHKINLERAEAAKALAAANAARAKAEAEAKALADAQAAKAKAEAAAARKAAKAPDKAKILAVAKVLRELAMPKVSSDEAADILLTARRKIDLIAAGLEDDAERHF